MSGNVHFRISSTKLALTPDKKAQNHTLIPLIIVKYQHPLYKPSLIPLIRLIFLIYLIPLIPPIPPKTWCPEYAPPSTTSCFSY